MSRRRPPAAPLAWFAFALLAQLAAGAAYAQLSDAVVAAFRG
jgi:hypothetical protein